MEVQLLSTLCHATYCMKQHLNMKGEARCHDQIQEVDHSPLDPWNDTCNRQSFEILPDPSTSEPFFTGLMKTGRLAGRTQDNRACSQPWLS
jgi:hypothetical protein